MEIRCTETHSLLNEDERIRRNEKKTYWVILLTTIMMIGEISAGYLTGSMALTADGWHMASHAGALLIAFFAYRLARNPKLVHRFSFGAGKLIPLGGYTSAVALSMVALFILIESAMRLFSPVGIGYNEAIGIAALGLLVNIASALILNDTHEHDDHSGHGDHVGHHHHVHDHNLRSAFIHVVADAFTSVLAIAALLLAKIYHLAWLDPAIGIVGAIVILVWAFQLCRDTGWELLDGHSRVVDWKRLRDRVEVGGAKIMDFHAWRIAPKAIACEMIVENTQPKGTDYYRQLLKDEFSIHHIIVEERAV